LIGGTLGAFFNSSNGTWALVQRSASQPTFDLSNLTISSSCRNESHARAAICLVNPTTGHPAYWKWAQGGLGHAAVYLFKCWSFWALMDERHGGVAKLMVDFIHHRWHWTASWQADMMVAMGAQWGRYMSYRELNAANPCMDKWSVVVNPLEDGESYFPRIRFAQRLVALFPQATVPVHGKALSVGVLNRRDNGRSWLDAGRFVRMLQAAAPPASSAAPAVRRAELWVNDNLTLVEQMTAIRRHHIVVSPHGAQLANLVFALPCTSLLELMQASLLNMEYQQLLVEVGGRPFFMYPGTQGVWESLKKTAVAVSDLRQAWYARVHTSGLDRLRAETVLEMLPRLVQAREDCLAGVPLESVPFDGVPTVGGLKAYVARMAKAENASEDVRSSRCFYCGGPKPCCAHPGGLRQPSSHRDVWDCPGCLPEI